MPVVHSSANVLSTDGVLRGQGPSSNVSTTSLSRRKSSCLKCSKPKPGPPVVSTSTTRAMPSASGLAQAGFAAAAAGGGGGVVGAGGSREDSEAVVSTSSLAASLSAASEALAGFAHVA